MKATEFTTAMVHGSSHSTGWTKSTDAVRRIGEIHSKAISYDHHPTQTSPSGSTYSITAATNISHNLHPQLMQPLYTNSFHILHLPHEVITTIAKQLINDLKAIVRFTNTSKKMRSILRQESRLWTGITLTNFTDVHVINEMAYRCGRHGFKANIIIDKHIEQTDIREEKRPSLLTLIDISDSWSSARLFIDFIFDVSIVQFLFGLTMNNLRELSVTSFPSFINLYESWKLPKLERFTDVGHQSTSQFDDYIESLTLPDVDLGKKTFFKFAYIFAHSQRLTHLRLKIFECHHTNEISTYNKPTLNALESLEIIIRGSITFAFDMCIPSVHCPRLKRLTITASDSMVETVSGTRQIVKRCIPHFGDTYPFLTSFTLVRERILVSSYPFEASLVEPDTDTEEDGDREDESRCEEEGERDHSRVINIRNIGQFLKLPIPDIRLLYKTTIIDVF